MTTASHEAAGAHVIEDATPVRGHAWIAPLPAELAEWTASDGVERIVVFEDGEPLGPPDALHDDIASEGAGRFSHWGAHVYYSSSDGTDPACNGRTYTVAVAEDPLLLRARRHLHPGLDAETRERAETCLRAVVQSGQVDTLWEVDRNVPVKGRDVLEVGCGQCWVAPLFLAAGARSYEGIELIGPLPDKRIFDRGHAGELWRDEHYLSVPMTLSEFLACFDGLRFTNADFTDTRLQGSAYDIVFLRVVSEHLLEPRKAFREMHRLLRPGGWLYLSHGSYQSWNGHHVAPHTVDEYDPADPAMAAVADWAHLEQLVENDRVDGHNLNYMRIHELAALLRSMYSIEGWVLTESSPEHGASRYSEEILGRHPEYYRDELLTEMVFATCRKPLEASAADRIGGELAAVPAASRAAIESRLLEGGELLELSRATAVPVWALVELREELRRRGTAGDVSGGSC